MMNPAGISGEATSGEKKFCVQTEFAPRPKPRITTSISLNGEVVQKVENVWDKLPKSEEDRDEIEKFLRKQHREVIKDIEDKGKRPVLSDEKTEKIATSGEKENQEVISKVRKVISGNEGVTGCVLFSKEDQIIGQDAQDTKDQAMVDLSLCTIDLVSFLSSVSKVGTLSGGLLENDQMKMVFIPIKDDLLSLRVDPDTDVKQLVQKVKSAV
jgi:hypothetical protein